MYDIIFIGGGLNYAGAIVAAKNGLKVALIEKNLDHLGGTCLHNGCIPSKHLLHLAKINCELKNRAFRIKQDKIKLSQAQKDIEEVVKKATRSIKIQCERMGVEIIEAKGYVVDKNCIEVENEVLKSKYIVIGTGSTPFIPKGIKYNKDSIVTSDEILKLNEFPENIAIYGSGAIGLEFASFFAANKIDTNLIYRKSRISDKIHPIIVEKIENGLKSLGINLMPNTTIFEAEDFERSARIKTDKGVMDFKKLLVATGRVPNVDAIKTEKIDIDKKILTDEFFQTTLNNHFAIGDCNGKLLLAHAARAQVLNVVGNILGKKSRLNLKNIPKFIYALPLQYASIGITRYELEKSSIEFKEAIFPLSAISISHSLGAEEGVVIAYADSEEFLIGAEILAPDAQELISILSVALALEADKNSILDAVFPHPTFSETIDRVLRRLKG